MSDRQTRQPASRADELRQKRQQPLRVPVMPAKKITPEPVKHPVVNPFGRGVAQPVQQPVKKAAVITTRSFPYSTPLRETVSTPARRKAYRVAPNGVETRLPALPILHFSWQWVSGFMVVVLLTAVILMLTLDVFKVNQIQVDGLQRVALADVQAVVQNNTKSIFTLDRQKVLNAIGITFPELTNVDLKVESTGVVHLTVTERAPVLTWTAGDYTYWFDADGVIMSPRGDAGALMSIHSTVGIPLTKPVSRVRSAVDFANLVLTRVETPLTPEDVINTLDPKVMEAAMTLNAQMPLGAMLVYDNISGMGWKDPRGWKVYFGLSLDNLAFQQVEYQAIVDRLAQQGITPSVISVEHIDSPYYRTE